MAPNVIPTFADRLRAGRGNSLPVFRGTYGEALRESMRQELPLIIYIHSDLHLDSDEFIENVLASQRLAAEISHLGVLLWVGSAQEPDGFEAASRFEVTGYPFLAVCAPADRRSPSGDPQYHKYWSHGGAIDVGILTTYVRAAVLEYRNLSEGVRATSLARDQHRDLVEEQERAYTEAVARDVARARETREVEELQAQERIRVEEEAELQAAIDLSKTLDKQGMVDACRRRLLASPEPPKGAPGLAVVRLQLPPSTKVERRFNASDELRMVRDFVVVTSADLKQDSILGPDAPFDLACAFPRKTFNTHTPGSPDLGLTLQAAGLAPQASLLVTIVVPH